MVFALAGGIGLFLLGMVLLTDGLKAFAGDALRRALLRFTGTPLKAFASGALVTVMIQSSSATTVTLIGFVSAGLLAFPQAVGVVLGASLGTTGTGWLVALLGLKVSLGLYAMPLVGAGAFLRLLGRGRWRSFGLALAGFGLIFVGIETLREGMQSLSNRVGPGTLPSGGFWGDLLAIGIGFAMTLVMQSSSAAVATTMTALHTGTVPFEQAALIVVGAAVGTTATGALAVIGGTVPAKRTALAHVLFNLATGVVALALLPLFLWGLRHAQENLGLGAGEASLAAFHTAFIGTGVLIVLPFVNAFARGIERLLPERGPRLTRHLDDTLLQAPEVALEATRRALSETACEAFGLLRTVVDGRDGVQGDLLRIQVEQALQEAQHFLARIPSTTSDNGALHARVSLMHAIDHMARLQARLNPRAGVRRMLAHARLQPAVEPTLAVLALAEAGLRGRAQAGWLATVEQRASELAQLRRTERVAFLNQTVDTRWGPSRSLEALDALRWLERVGHHTWRICSYLALRGPASPDDLDKRPGDWQKAVRSPDEP